jgi:pilus assembly protein Flp/PilA
MKEISAYTRGQGLVEYALILALVAIVVIVVLSILGPTVGNIHSNVVAGLEDVSSSEEAPEPETDCYGSLLLPYLVGLTTLFSLVFRLTPNCSFVMTKV